LGQNEIWGKGICWAATNHWQSSRGGISFAPCYLGSASKVRWLHWPACRWPWRAFLPLNRLPPRGNTPSFMPAKFTPVAARPLLKAQRVGDRFCESGDLRLER